MSRAFFEKPPKEGVQPRAASETGCWPPSADRPLVKAPHQVEIDGGDFGVEKDADWLTTSQLDLHPHSLGGGGARDLKRTRGRETVRGGAPRGNSGHRGLAWVGERRCPKAWF